MPFQVYLTYQNIVLLLKPT